MLCQGMVQDCTLKYLIFHKISNSSCKSFHCNKKCLLISASKVSAARGGNSQVYYYYVLLILMCFTFFQELAIYITLSDAIFALQQRLGSTISTPPHRPI